MEERAKPAKTRTFRPPNHSMRPDRTSFGEDVKSWPSLAELAASRFPERVKDLNRLGRHSISVMTVQSLKGEQVSPRCTDDMIVLVAEGQARWDYRIDGGKALTRRVRPGYMITVPAHTANHFASNASLVTHGVGIPRNVTTELIREAGGGDFADSVHVSQTGTTDEFCRSLILQLVEAARQPSQVNGLLVDHLGVALALRIARIANPRGFPRAVSRRLEFQEIRRVEDYVRSHLSESLSLQTLASVVEMTPFNFLRAFRLATGHTPHQWLLRLRAGQALEMLKANPSLTTAQAAAECGFVDRSHLARVVRQFHS